MCIFLMYLILRNILQNVLYLEILGIKSQTKKNTEKNQRNVGDAIIAWPRKASLSWDELYCKDREASLGVLQGRVLQERDRGD